MRSGGRHGGEAGGGWSGFPPLLATRGRIHKGDGDMRIGAIFARGSCRALKWMLVLGVLSVLGSAQAAAQAPRIETASYEEDTSRELDIKMSRDVFFIGTNPNDRLAGDFTLSGGAIGTTPLKPIRIDGLALTIASADDEFTLVFRERPQQHRSGGSSYSSRPQSAPLDLHAKFGLRRRSDSVDSDARGELAATTSGHCGNRSETGLYLAVHPLDGREERA